jgi:2-amino-4-hydroxy-6-hydroxymethyldihydropteridine diphosphokinase
VPHPELTQRAFALLPLLDVAPDARDPRTGVAYGVLARCIDADGVRRLAEPLRLPSAPPSSG